MDMIDNQVSSCLGEGKAFPPGFRFHPTDEELVLYYLKRKMCRRRHRLDVIGETDIYKWEPEELPGISKLRTGDRQWFFFSPRDRKYPVGTRSNRGTKHGYWKATGKDRIILCNSRNVGVKKTLVFYIGRAPKGERTDWVMHEYTMTEEELKICQSVKDNYALYKVFKKSGPGPKNGEQYGAPFMEEDWLDGLDANDLVGQVNNVTRVETTIPVSDNRVNSQLQSHGDGYEEFMNIIACEPISIQPLVVDSGMSFAEFLGEEESQNVFVGEALPSFDIIQSETSHLQLHDSPKVKSAVKSYIPLQHSNLIEENIEDFLALDDLISPEFSNEYTDTNRPTHVLEGDVHFDEFFDGLGEFDLYKDLPKFLCDGEAEGEAGGQGIISQQSTNNLGNGVAIPVSDFSNNNFVEGTTNLQQSYLWNRNDSNIVQWSHDQRRIVHTPGQAHQGTVPIATPGVVYDSNSVKHQIGANKNNSSKQGDGTDSWFSSSIWAFVESIPTNPASAAESAFVNHSFEPTVSSFSRLRTSVDVAAGSTRTNSTSSRLLCFSLLGILCAILWMFMVTYR